jgi:hypothetical protein
VDGVGTATARALAVPMFTTRSRLATSGVRGWLLEGLAERAAEHPGPHWQAALAVALADRAAAALAAALADRRTASGASS